MIHVVCQTVGFVELCGLCRTDVFTPRLHFFKYLQTYKTLLLIVTHSACVLPNAALRVIKEPERGRGFDSRPGHYQLQVT